MFCAFITLLLCVFLRSTLAYTGTYINHTHTIANTTYGQIRGARALQDDGKFMDVYVGIPFAAPPVGQLRFAPPQNPNPWTGVLDTLVFKPACPQRKNYLNDVIGGEFDNYDEDCLYLNVYSPVQTNSRNGLLPVMVWIHGGCYIVGTTEEYDGSILAQNGVVVVTVNYRLAALGFMSTDDDASPGNYGLQDNIKALQWVRDNIANFGGDPNQVTVFGQSAGAGCSTLLLFQSAAKGLFHKVIAISGTSMARWSMYRSPFVAKGITMQLAEAVNCAEGSSQDIVDCLRTKTWQEISEVIIKPHSGTCDWMPTIDGNIIVDDTRDLVARGEFNNVPLMIGSTKDEQSYPSSTMSKEMFDSVVERYANTRWGHTGNEDAIYHALVYQYTDPLDPLNEQTIRNSWTQMCTDEDFTAPSDYHSKHHALLQENTYKYSFHYRSKFDPSPPFQGVTHGKDLVYTFGTPFLEPNRTCPWGCYNNWYDSQPYWTNADRDMSELSMTLFTNFAKYSDPTPTPVNGITWDKFDNSTYAYLEFDDVTELKFNYKAREMLFWEDYLLTIINREQEVAEPIVITLPPEVCEPSSGILSTHNLSSVSYMYLNLFIWLIAFANLI
ncbi:neuroligin-4, X-linked-like [Glandiceps talaboti]